jgi:hypothetical protein
MTRLRSRAGDRQARTRRDALRDLYREPQALCVTQSSISRPGDYPAPGHGFWGPRATSSFRDTNWAKNSPSGLSRPQLDGC